MTTFQIQLGMNTMMQAIYRGPGIFNHSVCLYVFALLGTYHLHSIKFDDNELEAQSQRSEKKN